MNDCDTSQWSQPCYTVVFTCLGIEELNAGKTKLRVYPNPAKGFAVFETLGVKGLTLSQTLNTRVIVIDVYGQTVAELPVTSQKTLWHTDGVENGVYFYRVEIEGDVLSGKIVIQK
jgi:hypothetical protein